MIITPVVSRHPGGVVPTSLLTSPWSPVHAICVSILQFLRPFPCCWVQVVVNTFAPMASYGAVEDPARTAHSPAGLQSRRCLKTTAGIAVAAMAGFVLCLVWKNAEGAAPAPRRAPPGTQALAAAAHAAGPRQPTTVYLGNGCFWARQLALVHVEQQSAAFRHRSPGAVTALAGYAGSTRTGPDGLVCYHGGPSGTVYAGLGDCEVVQVALDSGGGDGPGGEKEEFGALLQSFFASFVSLGAGTSACV